MRECFRGGLKTPRIVQEAVNEATILSLVSHGPTNSWAGPGGGLIPKPGVSAATPAGFARHARLRASLVPPGVAAARLLKWAVCSPASLWEWA
jgi:hypothetical protein